VEVQKTVAQDRIAIGREGKACSITHEHMELENNSATQEIELAYKKETHLLRIWIVY